MTSKEPRITPLQQSPQSSGSSIGINARSYPAVRPAPVVQAMTNTASQPAPIQRRVGIEVETGIPVFETYLGDTKENDPNLFGLIYNGVPYSRDTRGNINGVELHADSGGQVFGSPRKQYFEDKIQGKVNGIPKNFGKASIIEVVTSKQGLVDELGDNGKQNLSNHLDEINTQINALEQPGLTPLGTQLAGVDNHWPVSFRDAMLKNGYSPQVNIGIDLGGLSGLFSNPMGPTLTNGHFWGIGQAEDVNTEIAAIINKARLIPIEGTVMPGNRLLNCLQGVLDVLLSYFKGIRAGHNITETEKNEVPFMLKGTFKELWEELQEQFPEDQKDVDPIAWYTKVNELIESTLDNNYKLQSGPAGRLGNHLTISGAFETLMNGGNIATTIASGESVDNDKDSSINDDVSEFILELDASAERKTPVLEMRHMTTVQSGEKMKENAMAVVEGIIERQLQQFNVNDQSTIKTRSGW